MRRGEVGVKLGRKHRSSRRVVAQSYDPPGSSNCSFVMEAWNKLITEYVVSTGMMSVHSKNGARSVVTK